MRKIAACISVVLAGPKMSSTQLTHRTFSDFVSNCPFAVIHFWAEWNGYDHTMRTRLEEIKSEFPSITFAEFDIDPAQHHAICLELGVQGPPFLAIYSGGSLVETRIGMLEREDLRLLMNSLLGSIA